TDGGSNDGEAGSGGEGGAVPVCDLTQAPSSKACLVSDEFAVFVSPLGTNEGTGAKSDPLLSIGAAIEAAAQQQKVVIACSTEKAVFTAPLELSGDVTARVYGGFDCATWTQGSTPTLVAPAERGPALTLEGVSGALLFEDFEFRSKDALDGDGESSIAAVVSESEGVVFRRVLLSAGKGGQGRPGESGGDAVTEPAPRGHDAQGVDGGNAQQDCGCATLGGRGGDAVGRVDGDPGLPELGAGMGGKGGEVCENGKPGAAAPATPGALGAKTHGTLEGAVWTPSPGQDGETGKAGQGGGGGGGQDKSKGGAGGGGGCGGCGGQGGKGGGGGGASIGLLLLDSSVTFEDSLVVSSDAGDGGDGGSPQPGQTGGNGGLPSSGGCLGGLGGAGAPGGAGGGGAGGLSVGIFFQGTAPSLDGVSISTGMRGSGGTGSQAASTDDDGLDGDNPETLDADA
ncbi:MAG: hypothetical protein M3020_17520, partial [Myxococcota bacterium]|nr:hypothetical protein [Myxococcota bacterium]